MTVHVAVLKTTSSVNLKTGASWNVTHLRFSKFSLTINKLIEHILNANQFVLSRLLAQVCSGLPMAHHEGDPAVRALAIKSEHRVPESVNSPIAAPVPLAHGEAYTNALIQTEERDEETLKTISHAPTVVEDVSFYVSFCTISHFITHLLVRTRLISKTEIGEIQPTSLLRGSGQSR